MKQSAQKHLDELALRYPSLRPCQESILAATKALISCFNEGGKLLVCGNGGSAADSQHIVGELMKGFVLPRKLDDAMGQKLRAVCPDAGIADTLFSGLQGALPAISLVSENALSTAYSNDMSPELCFAQQVLGHGKPIDILLGISTSGHSKNVLYAAHVAHAKGMSVIGLSGRDGGALAQIADVCIIAPAMDTYQIQEYHLPIYHAICLAVEAEFFG